MDGALVVAPMPIAAVPNMTVVAKIRTTSGQPVVGTLAELTALSKPMVFVPLASSAANEQAHNARHLQEAGAAVALEGAVTADQVRDSLRHPEAGPC